VRDQVSHPYKTTGRITVLYFNLYISIRHAGRQKTEFNVSKHSLKSFCS
jgi:hypothetical protein